METKDIDINGQVFPCPVRWTVALAEREIRSWYGFQGGGIYEDGIPVLEAELISSLTGTLIYVCLLSDRLIFQAQAESQCRIVIATVGHMQSQRTSTIRCPNSFEAFRIACAGYFYIERLMYGAHLNVYHFPTFPVCHMSDGLRITEENYAEVFTSWQSKPLTTTSIYLWSERPVDDIPYDDYGDVEFSRPSPSEFRREMLNKYAFCCLACKHVYKNATSALEVCHILQIEETNGLCAEEQMDLIRKCDLVDIDDPHNFILLCGTCHIHFDNHLLGIKRDDDAFRWVVKPTLEQTPLPHSTKTYGGLLDSNIRFPYASPMPRVIDHRYKRYIWGTKARKRKADVLDQLEYERFAERLREIGCSDETIMALWNDHKISLFTVQNRKPRRISDWVEIQPSSIVHEQPATFWYNETSCRIWIKPTDE